MRSHWLVIALTYALVGSLVGDPGRWDHHGNKRNHARKYVRTTTTTTTTTTPAPKVSPRRSWTHSLGWTIPAERCQIPKEPRRLASGTILDSNYIDYVKDMLVEDKALLSPVVFEGAMVSRTNTFRGLYFVSFKVFRVFKGQIHQQLQGQVRLLFQTQPQKSTLSKRKTGLRASNCPPVPFNVKSGRKFLIFVKKIKTPGRYVAVAEPELVRKKTLKAVKHVLGCSKCVIKPALRTPKSKRVSDGSKLRLKCKVTNRAYPSPAIAWYKDGALLTARHAAIDTKKKRSVLVVQKATARDSGIYTCQATNIAGTSASTTSVTVRHTAPQTHQASSCPIHSYCLNGGSCLYYQSIGELVCRCSEGFTGQRCQFKKALRFKYPNPLNRTTGCGAYGYDINQLCSAWREAPEEMTKEQYQEWKIVQEMELSLRRNTSSTVTPGTV